MEMEPGCTAIGRSIRRRKLPLYSATGFVNLRESIMKSCTIFTKWDIRFFLLEHRGHGFSQRYVQDPDRVYVKSYQEYVSDLKAFLDQVVRKEMRSRNMFLFAHSMGGAIGALFLEEYPSYFKKAVLSSPMMQMNFGKIPEWEVKFLVFWSRIAHWNTGYVPGQHGFDGSYGFEGSSCLSKARYDYVFRLRKEVPEYTTYGGTYAWTRASIQATREIAKSGKGRYTGALVAGRQRFYGKAGGTAVFCGSCETGAACKISGFQT